MELFALQADAQVVECRAAGVRRGCVLPMSVTRPAAEVRAESDVARQA